MQAKQVLPLVILAILLFTVSCSGGKQVSTAKIVLEPTLPEPPPKKPETLLLSFIGDIMAHEMNFERPPYENIYAAVKDTLRNDDLTFGNLEFPVVPELPMADYPLFNNHIPYVQAAIDGGVDVFSAANNHTTDKGTKGILRTFETLQELRLKNGIFFSGISHEPGAPYAMTSIARNGYSIGFIAITEFLNAYSGMEYVYLVDYKNQDIENAFLSFLKGEREKYDLIIVSVHGGVEYARYPANYKKEFFHALVNVGADIVWGHHPHVVQPWELARADGVNRLIMYSAGNFISGQIWFLDPLNPHPVRRYTGDSIIFRVRVGRIEEAGPDNGDNAAGDLAAGKVSVFSVEPVHFSNYKDPEKGMIVAQIVNLTMTGAVPASWEAFYDDKYLEVRRFLQDTGELRQFPQ